MALQVAFVAKAAMGVLSVGAVAIGLLAVAWRRSAASSGGNEEESEGQDSQDRSIELFTASELGLRQLSL